MPPAVESSIFIFSTQLERRLEMERVEHAIAISKMRTHVLQLRDKYEQTAGSTFQTIDDIARARVRHSV